MSVRVVARIRPLLKTENDIDTIVKSDGADELDSNSKPTVVKIPNPKNMSENYSFQFSSVYGQTSTQQEIFEAEITPTVKHLFKGFDVTIFAYGSTGTGKTHTMRGGKAMADRGMIPRLLSAIYRRSKKLEKDTNGETQVEVCMSYYEIYNDKVFDLLEAPEKRTATGLPLREAGGGKTVVVGLSETPCDSLKEFEILYDKANSNRSTSATKLNAHSSRSHAILCVKVTVTSPTEIRVSTASAIDLAGSEDNRRTGNDKDRMVESASINKSLFVLAQCVEAISKKQTRIPYRESKMTRILSLGQNNGLTVMILNLAPVKSYHLDTLSSLNFANRTKKIEVREVENEPIFRGPAKPVVAATTLNRQPLRALSTVMGNNMNIAAGEKEKAAAAKPSDKPLKAFAVYSDNSKSRPSHPPIKSSPLKRGAESAGLLSNRPSKISRPPPNYTSGNMTSFTKNTIEAMVEKKVSEILAQRSAAEQPAKQVAEAPNPQESRQYSDEVRLRLESIEQRLEGQEGARAEGLSFLLMAKQHQARGEDSSALKMYQLAVPFFPDNAKLQAKIEKLKSRMQALKEKDTAKNALAHGQTFAQPEASISSDRSPRRDRSRSHDVERDDSYHDAAAASSEDEYSEPTTKPRKQARPRKRPSSPDPLGDAVPASPRTAQLLRIINTRDVAQIKLLRGVGAKKAEGIVECLLGMGKELELRNLRELGGLKGVGAKTVESMRLGIEV